MGRIVITGGAGFIGSHLTDRALAEGNEVVIVDNLLTGSRANIAQHDSNPRLTVMEHDISTPFHVDGPVTSVFHLASPASPLEYLRFPIKTLKVGALGTHNALGLAMAKGASLLISSTSEVYGDPHVHPQTEDYWGNVNPIGPRSCYDEAKRYAEAMCMAYHRKHGVRVRIARIFNTYGPRMALEDGRVLPNFMCQALRNEPLTLFGDGSQTRSFCFVTDLVDGLWRLMGLDDPMPVNLGNPTEMTIRQFGEKIIALTGSTSGFEHRPLPQDDPKIRKPDITRARDVLGWEPAVPLDAGLEPTIDDFRTRLG